MRPCTFLPPCECSGRTSDFSGSLLVTSEKSEPLAPRLPRVVGLYLRIAMSGRVSLKRPKIPSCRPLRPAVPGATALPRAVQGVHPGYLDPEHGLDREPDLGLVGAGGDDEGVLALVEQPVALLRDHRPQQDVPRVADPAHLLASFADRETNAVRACSVKTTWSLASTS